MTVPTCNVHVHYIDKWPRSNRPVLCMFRLYGRGSDGRSTAGDDDSTVLELQQRLHEKDMKLTDTQLEALSSAAQLEQLREAMNKMKVRDYGVRDVSVADRDCDISTTPVARSLYMYGMHCT